MAEPFPEKAGTCSSCGTLKVIFPEIGPVIMYRVFVWIKMSILRNKGRQTHGKVTNPGSRLLCYTELVSRGGLLQPLDFPWVARMNRELSPHHP